MPTPASNRAEAPASLIRIVLADDHAVVRSALRMLLDAEPGLEVELRDQGAADLDQGAKPALVERHSLVPGSAGRLFRHGPIIARAAPACHSSRPG